MINNNKTSFSNSTISRVFRSGVRLSLKPCSSFDLIGLYYPIQNYQTFSFWCNGVIKCFLIAFGIIGNGLLITQVIRKGTLKNRMGAYLRMLCIWDTLLLSSSLVRNAAMSVIYKTMHFHGFAAYILFIAYPVGNLAVTGTLWQVVIISMERYIHIVYPWRARIYDQRVSVRKICFVILVVALILNSTFFLEHRIKKCIVISANLQVRQSSIQIEKTKLALESQIYKIACDLVPDLLFRCPLPFILVTFFASWTLYQIYFSNIIRPRNSAADRERYTQSRRAKIELTMLTLKFLICNSLFTVHVIMDLLDTKSEKTPRKYWAHFLTMSYISDVSNILLVLNAATNWLLFYGWSNDIETTVRTSVPMSNLNESIRVTPKHSHAQRRATTEV